MSVEILTIDLSEDTIAKLANRVAQVLSGMSVSVSENTHRTQRAEVSQETDDPWGVPDPTSGGGNVTPIRPTATNPPSPTSGPSGEQVIVIETKNGNQTWRLNRPEAPMCDHGVRAGKVSAMGSNGKRWTAWRCEKGSGQDWRNKCDFNEWTK